MEPRNSDTGRYNFCITEAKETDIPAMADLLEILFSIEEDFQCNRELQEQGLKMLLLTPLACAMVARAEQKVVGMCTGQLIISTAEGGPAVLVEDVVVSKEFRGRGLGRQLLENLERWARHEGATRLQLMADRNNTEALEFYRHMGWQSTELICLRRKDT